MFKTGQLCWQHSWDKRWEKQSSWYRETDKWYTVTYYARGFGHPSSLLCVVVCHETRCLRSPDSNNTLFAQVCI